MNDFFEQYGWTIIEIIAGLISIVFIVSVYKNTVILNSQSMNCIDSSTTVAKVEYEIPEVTSFIVKNGIIDQNSQFHWQDYVEIKTNHSMNINDYIQVHGHIDTSTLGTYELLFELNFNGQTIVKKGCFYVREVW